MRLEVEQQTSRLMNASAVATTCPRQPAKIHQRLVLVDVEFVTKEIRIKAEISCCPRCNKVNCCAFPETIPDRC